MLVNRSYFVSHSLIMFLARELVCGIFEICGVYSSALS
jgi:hypothetical protein